MKLIPLILLISFSTFSADLWTYWIQPCTTELSKASSCEAADNELAIWALQAWQTAARNALEMAPAPSEQKARLRIYWVNGRQGLYGEARPLLVDGRPGAAIFVLPDVAALGKDIAQAASSDKLYRDAIVYLTCLHESGHALGLRHTMDYGDIMYSFGYGGDIPAYFNRYRKTLNSRSGIPHSSGISPHDRDLLAAALLP